MLVFISDLHLTDRSSGTTIKPGAFQKFAGQLEDMVGDAQAAEVDVILLGDVIDVIRSSLWLEGAVRPWSYDAPSQPARQARVLAIVDAICQDAANQACAGHLKDLRDRMAKASPPVTVRYWYVIGNHDWLINLYPAARASVAELFGLSDNPADPFPDCYCNSDYRVVARHGDLYDRNNHDGDRAHSSLGDAVVIELLNKFPLEVARQLGAAEPDLAAMMKEVDNVRPLSDIVKWVQHACLHAKLSDTPAKVVRIWNDLLATFTRIPFVRDRLGWWQILAPPARWLSRKLSLEQLAEIPLAGLTADKIDWTWRALQEDAVRKGNATYVVYGHTHADRIVPLWVNEAPLATEGLVYFNSGTWRTVHERSTYGALSFEGWQVMTFVAVYRETERQGRPFEVWNGALATM